ncbi:MAG: phage tail sheath C-terminal domain-containing protein, partial [Pseudomonadota bacterium]
ASTSVAAFIGPVLRGRRDEPVFITSAQQYANLFGELDGAAGGIRNFAQNADHFGHAIQAFFANGGAKAYIVRVAEDTEDDGGTALQAAAGALPNPEDASNTGFHVTAVDEGTWGDAIQVRLAPTDNDDSPDFELGYTFEVGIEDDGSFVALESFVGVQMADDDPQSIVSIVNEQSRLVNLESADIGPDDGEIAASVATSRRSGALPGGTLDLVGRGLVVTVDGTSTTVAFSADSADPQAIADTIQAQVRLGDADLPDFTVDVVEVSGTLRLQLISGILGPSGAVTVAAPAGPGAPDSAITANRLNLGGNATDEDYPNADLSAGGTMVAWLADGANGDSAPSIAAYQEQLLRLRDYRDISIMLLPGQNWIENGDNSIIQAAITEAELGQRAMVIVDPPDTSVLANHLNTPKDVKDLGVSTSPYVALYYPWLEVANSYYDPDTAANLPARFAIPPSAFAAGMWSRIDGARGVWKAPAGLEATVRSTIGPNILIGNDLQDNLNSSGVNCIRSIIGPPVIWGGRTRATRTKPEFRYIPVRRTQNMIGESLYRALQAVVFEPNDHRLWASLRASTTAFMDTLHRAGAFQGEKASDAYYVQCGLGSTMTQADIDNGVVIVAVGFAPLKPAEFVLVQIRQIVGQTA